ncbi:hypothetical protein Ancab_002290, partial [Ancistrocladus abbreviatus]
MDRMRMDDVDSVRITLEDSEVHGKGYSKHQSSPVNLSPTSFLADIPITGINGNHALLKERATHDGLVAAFTSKPMVNRNRPVDSDWATYADCINESDSVTLSRGISKSRFTRHKSSSLRREKRSAVDIDVKKDLSENSPGHQGKGLGSQIDPSVSHVGPSPYISSAEMVRSKSRPTRVVDTVSNYHQPEKMSLSSLQGPGPSNKLKGRFRHPVIMMGRFKIGVKKKLKSQRKGSDSRSNEAGGISIDDSCIYNMNRLILHSPQEPSAQRVWE